MGFAKPLRYIHAVSCLESMSIVQNLSPQEKLTSVQAVVGSFGEIHFLRCKFRAEKCKTLEMFRVDFWGEEVLSVIFAVAHKYDSNKNTQFFSFIVTIAPHQASQRCAWEIPSVYQQGKLTEEQKANQELTKVGGGMGPICGDAEIGDEMLPSYLGVIPN